ncbi:telomere length and silencing protein 1 homolog isoform X2 [Cygnus olor]|uniref:telomere length and silencing protein 1 homolog isoform X2 n=1 Tax=Cygnus olor TaxID=8869 RepID=UPI001ADE2F41|nr:telomere length and silencing protein 1 homolog isoform X2 [Cygnus olor]
MSLVSPILTCARVFSLKQVLQPVSLKKREPPYGREKARNQAFLSATWARFSSRARFHRDLAVGGQHGVEIWGPGLKLEEAKEVQSLRKRPNGVSAVALLVGEKLQEEATLVDDPFKIKSGGMVDMKKLKERGKDRINEEEDLNLGTSFSAETNRRDEDADMMKYIETELKKRKGIVENEEQKVKLKNAEDSLYELPENIRVSSAKKTEEMLSNQMLSGIPEVDLGIDAKIKNIISTEEAKAKLLAEQQNKKKDSETSFVPTNMAVNYVQHNRFYHEELNAPVRRNKEEPKPRPLRVGDTERPEPERSPPNRKRPPNEKATDDYHYEKFKKMNRRY